MNNKNKNIIPYLLCIMLVAYTIIPFSTYCSKADKVISQMKDNRPTIKIETSGEGNGTVMDSVISSLSDYTNATCILLAEFAIQTMASSFSPSFTTILNLSDRSGGTVGNNYEYEQYDQQTVRNSTFMKMIFNLGIYIGAALATVILGFGLYMCFWGRSEMIKDSPFSLLFKYIAVMIGIYISFDIVYLMIETMSSLWNGYIWGGISLADIGTNGTSGFEQLFGTDIMGSSNTGSSRTILGIMLDVGDNVIVGKIIFPLISIFLVWKLLKNILRLYLEVAERYFVLMILACFFPSALATWVSNGTRNILSSYLRMFICQGFVMIANMAFLKFYVFVGSAWMYSLTNWVAGLAFLKVCQKIDSYMMAMGLNVAQTGGAVVGSIGGALRSGVMMLSAADRVIGNAGKALMQAGVNENNYATYQKGATMAAGLTGNMIHNVVNNDASVKKFESAVEKLNGVSVGIHNVDNNGQEYALHKAGVPETQIADGIGTNQISSYEVLKNGNISEHSNQGTVDNNGLANALHKAGVPETQLSKLTAAGIDTSKITSFEVLQNGNVAYRTAQGTVTTSINGEIYTSSSIEADQEYQRRRMEAHKSWKENGEPIFEQAQQAVGGVDPEDIDPSERIMAETQYYAENGYKDVVDSNTATDAPSADVIKAEYGEKDGYFDLHILNDTAIDSALNKLSVESTGENTDGGFYGIDTPGHSTLRCVGTVDKGANTIGEGAQFEKSSFRLDCYNAAQFPELSDNIGNTRYVPGEWRSIEHNGQRYYIHKTEETNTKSSISNLKMGMTKKAKFKPNKVRGEKPDLPDK